MATTTTRTTGQTVEYLRPAETAKLIRRALADAFPGVTFWVRTQTYAGGASADVYYDGIESWEEQPGRPGRFPVYRPGMPTLKEVEDVAAAYQSGGFDGTIDLAYNRDVYLDAEGRVLGGASHGTQGSRGVFPAYDTGRPADARVVHTGLGYIFVNGEPPFDVRQKRGAA